MFNFIASGDVTMILFLYFLSIFIICAFYNKKNVINVLKFEFL